MERRGLLGDSSELLGQASPEVFILSVQLYDPVKFVFKTVIGVLLCQIGDLYPCLCLSP
jgi:hypothetical protein